MNLSSQTKQSKRRLWMRSGAGFLAAVIAIAGIWAWDQSQPTQNGPAQLVQIPAGSTSKQIANLLENKGLIKNALLFQFSLWRSHQSGHLQAGTYQLKPGMTQAEIIDLIASGKSIPDTIRFTIPEGYTIEQIAARLDQLGIAKKQEFLDEADRGQFQSSLIPSQSDQGPYRHRLEGFLFPSTYEIFKGSTPHQIIQLMLDRMQQEITPERIAKWKDNGLTVQQGLTLASLVEREARVSSERPIIARVILNRLHATPPMPLQIDATVQYVVGQKQELTYDDLKRESPYNTYLHNGLPPGPIACPGDESIAASCNPGTNTYLYYVTKKDGSGTHYFADTYAQQLANEQLSMQNARKGG